MENLIEILTNKANEEDRLKIEVSGWKSLEGSII